MAEQILIFDIDGTLAETSKSRLDILREFSVSSPQCMRSVPENIIKRFMSPELLIEEHALPGRRAFLKNDTRPRWFLTARWESLRSVTLDWLERQGWERARGFMRPNDHTHLPSVHVKTKHLINRFAADMHRALLIDDDPDMLLVARRLGFDAVHPDQFFGT